MKVLTIVIITTVFAFCQSNAQNNYKSPLEGLKANSFFNIEGEFEIADFENLRLEPNSYWNGSDLSGGFQSGAVNFPNYYNESWASWSGWAYSNMADDSTPGYLNQFSAITAAGFNPDSSQGVNYGVAYVQADFVTTENIPIPLYFNDGNRHEVKGFYVTNSTFASMTMEYGDDFTEKFGGETGNDPDFFKLSVLGYFDGIETDVVDFYLADYRFADNTLDYIIKTWQWVELSSLGQVDSLHFTLSSSDVGVYGMNTPGYFCIDHLYVVPAGTFINDNKNNTDFSIKVYPNPATYFVSITGNAENVFRVSVFDIHGHIVLENAGYSSGEMIDVKNLKEGFYFIRVQNKLGISTGIFVKSR